MNVYITANIKNQTLSVFHISMPPNSILFACKFEMAFKRVDKGSYLHLATIHVN
jgi:hypothetical protein